MEGTTLVWWERKLQKGRKHNGKLLSSWSKFTSAIGSCTKIHDGMEKFEIG